MLSVIIPTLNCERVLVPTLASLVSGAAAGTVRDVIIVDGGSGYATVDVADLAGCEIMVFRGAVAGAAAGRNHEGARELGHVSAARRRARCQLGR